MGGHSDSFMILLVHGVWEVLTVFHALSDQGSLLFDSSLDECLDCVAEPSTHWHVWLSFLSQWKTPKKATMEHRFTSNNDGALIDFLHKAFSALCEIELHVFFHVNMLDPTHLCCHMVHEILHSIIIVGAHPIRIVGQCLLHGVPLLEKTHVFVRDIPKVALLDFDDAMSVRLGLVG